MKRLFRFSLIGLFVTFLVASLALWCTVKKCTTNRTLYHWPSLDTVQERTVTICGIELDKAYLNNEGQRLPAASLANTFEFIRIPGSETCYCTVYASQRLDPNLSSESEEVVVARRRLLKGLDANAAVIIQSMLILPREAELEFHQLY